MSVVCRLLFVACCRQQTTTSKISAATRNCDCSNSNPNSNSTSRLKVAVVLLPLLVLSGPVLPFLPPPGPSVFCAFVASAAAPPARSSAAPTVKSGSYSPSKPSSLFSSFGPKGLRFAPCQHALPPLVLSPLCCTSHTPGVAALVAASDFQNHIAKIFA